MTEIAFRPPRRIAIHQEGVVRLVLLLVVGALILGPLFVLVRTSLAPAGKLPFETAAFTFAHFATIFSSADLLAVAGNTLVYALGSVAIGVAIATAIAWLTERTDMPGRVAIRVMMFSWMAIPPVAMGFGWILLINPGSGALNVFLQWLFGLERPPLTIYSFTALVGITALAVVPTAFVMIGGLMRNMDPQLEAAGRVAGATGAAVARRITLPLMLPGLLSVAIYMVMMVVQAFDLPMIIGLTARIPVLSTRIYLLSSPDAGIPNYGLSAALGVLLLLIARGLVWGYFRATRASERFRTVTGKAFRPKRVALGRWRLAALAAVSVYILLMLLPLAMLAWASLLPSYRPPSLAAFGDASLDVYARVLASPTLQRAVGNTLLLVFGSATLTMLLAGLVAWFSTRGESRAGKLVDALSFAPTAVPPVVMVLAILILYLNTPLYGTLAILILAQVTIYVAFGVRTMASALMQLHKELADAALVAGASWATMLRRVVLPLVAPQMLNGWLWVAAHAARDLTVPLMLMSAGNVVVASALWTMWDFPDLPGAAALAMLLVAGLLALVVPLQVLAARGER